MEIDLKFTPKPKIRILIVTAYRIIQQSLRILLEDNRDMEVVRTVGSFDELANPNNLLNADVALIYLIKDDQESIDCIAKLLEISPLLRVVVVTKEKDFESQTKAVKLGAVGIVEKEQNARNLVEAIRQTFRGETWINQTLLTRLLTGKVQPNGNSQFSADGTQTETPTAREKEVILLIGQGLKNKEIALKLGISEATVRHHLSSIYGKLGVDDRLNLVIYAYQHGLITIDNPSPEHTHASSRII